VLPMKKPKNCPEHCYAVFAADTLGTTKLTVILSAAAPLRMTGFLGPCLFLSIHRESDVAMVRVPMLLVRDWSQTERARPRIPDPEP
jgi:hypothetical protein